MQSRTRRLTFRSACAVAVVLTLGLLALLTVTEASAPARSDASTTPTSIMLARSSATTPMSVGRAADGPAGRTTRVWGFYRLNWTNVWTQETSKGRWEHASPYGDGRSVYLDRTADSDEWVEVSAFGDCLDPYTSEEREGTLAGNATCS